MKNDELTPKKNVLREKRLVRNLFSVRKGIGTHPTSISGSGVQLQRVILSHCKMRRIR